MTRDEFAKVFQNTNRYYDLADKIVCSKGEDETLNAWRDMHEFVNNLINPKPNKIPPGTPDPRD